MILQEDFETDSTSNTIEWPGGSAAVILNANHQMYGPIDIPVSNISEQNWLRLEADFMVQTREWSTWKHTQWIVQFFSGEEAIKTNIIRLQRLIDTDHVSTHLFFDVRLPEQPFDRCAMTLWNAESAGQILMDNLVISTFIEK